MSTAVCPSERKYGLTVSALWLCFLSIYVSWWLVLGCSIWIRNSILDDTFIIMITISIEDYV